MPRPLYESDATKLIRELLKEKPHIIEEQKKGRGLWWDKKLDAEELERDATSRVKQKPYVYQTDG
jgi:hypothetical protein